MLCQTRGTASPITKWRYIKTFFHIKFSEKITILIGINLRMHDSFSYKTKVLIAKLHIKIIPTELKWQIILIQGYAGR